MQQKTNFQKVTMFNGLMGQGVAEKPSLPSFAQVHLRSSLIMEEAVTEFQKAVMSRDLVEIADAIGDSLVVVYGAANDFGLDADTIFEAVHNSNMSKLCKTEEDAKLAVELYAKGGYHGKEALQAAYRQTDGGFFVVFDATTNKTLKGPDFVSPKEILEKIIFPSGRPASVHDTLKEKAYARLSAGQMSPEAYWSMCETLEAPEEVPAA